MKKTVKTLKNLDKNEQRYLVYSLFVFLYENDRLNAIGMENKFTDEDAIVSFVDKLNWFQRKWYIHLIPKKVYRAELIIAQVLDYYNLPYDEYADKWITHETENRVREERETEEQTQKKKLQEEENQAADELCDMLGIEIDKITYYEKIMSVLSTLTKDDVANMFSMCASLQIFPIYLNDKEQDKRLQSVYSDFCNFFYEHQDNDLSHEEVVRWFDKECNK